VGRPQAAQSVGIPLGQIWFMVWAVAGLVALVANDVGTKLGVQFSLPWSRSRRCRC
jgi:branched-chain amino acid transport system permease protein